MISVYELQNRIEGMYASPSSEEGRKAIEENEDVHIAEVWQDGEITVTKTGTEGSLYGQRRIHESEPAFLPVKQMLFPREEFEDEETWYEVYMGRENKKMVILDDELRDILAEYRDHPVNQKRIRAYQRSQLRDQNGVSKYAVDLAFGVLEAMRDGFDEDGMGDEYYLINDAHYLLQEYDQGANWKGDNDGF